MIVDIIVNIFQHIFITALQHDTIPSVLTIDYLGTIELIKYIPFHII